MATHSQLNRATLHGSERLRLTARFSAIHREGRWVRGRWMFVGALPNHLPVTRLGLRVQRGTKGAVIRNRLKRVFRSVYRSYKTTLTPGYDVVVVLRKTADVDQGELTNDFFAACGMLGVLVK